MRNKALFLVLGFLCLSNHPLLAQKKLKTENVVLVTLDGFRWRELFTGADEDLISEKDFVSDEKALKSKFWDDDALVRRKKLLPFIWTTIATQGQIYGNRKHDNKVNVDNRHRFSYPGYNEILTGFTDDRRVDSNDKKDNPNKSVLEFINQQKGFRKKVAAFSSWDVFPYILNVKRSGLLVNAGFDTARGPHLSSREKFLNRLQAQVPSPWSSVRLDAFTHHYALEHLRKNSPRVLYLAYGETDDFAHNGNYEAYLKSAHQTDAFIKDLWTWLQRSPKYRNKTTLVITTDHGRGNTRKSWQNHGSNIGEADETWFIAIGPDTKALGEVKQPAQYYTKQLAQTITTLLGLPYTSDQPAGEPVKTVINQ
ncbi:alkaline phosphatase family protein [Adhaeribacter radiodurans]|uniref:Alkaline phosphatase family protein n=1 Tax=Adhaeribacter radiodurans TaxID=2745197 RepID=A0A7L7LDD2_9BACT|nr:alkaline phosphatase family protein [Adhaeribacter radiodurans]QMU30852.1 alkaline phosphatase family protein [Adhaeribacter radiodurans]